MAEVAERERGTSRSRWMRVFVSSTFRDMHAERDALVKHAFPLLRQACEARGVAWGEVDLRWGITDEDAAEGRVLPICLAEIEACRPFFIGILGERYGYVPDGPLPPDLVEQEPWLAKSAGASVTELEIMHGVFNNPAMAVAPCSTFAIPLSSKRSSILRCGATSSPKALPITPGWPRSKHAFARAVIRCAKGSVTPILLPN